MYKLRSSGLGTTVSPGLGRVPMLVLVPPRLSSSRVFIPITKPTLAPASLRHQPLVTGWSRRNWRPGHSNPCRELLYICHHSHQSIGHTSGPDHTATCWSPQKSETNNRTCGDGWSQNHFIRHKIFKYTDEIVSDTVLLLTFTSKIGLYVTYITHEQWSLPTNKRQNAKMRRFHVKYLQSKTTFDIDVSSLHYIKLHFCHHCIQIGTMWQ